MIKKDSAGFLAVKTNTRLLGDDHFAYFSPCERLKTWISNYTITFPTAGVISDDYTIMPHGSATLVTTFDGVNQRSQLFGPTSKPCPVGKSANGCSVIFIIEFQPAGLFVFTGINQNQLMDTIIPFEQISPRLDSAIKEIFCHAATAEELLTRIERQLLNSQCSHYPAELSLAIQMIIQHNGTISLKEITEKTFYSERHLNRLFNHYLGFNLKHFSRIVRMNKAIDLLNHTNSSLDDISAESGFYDISHFIRDFKAVCGITPQEYRSNMSDFYSAIAKF